MQIGIAAASGAVQGGMAGAKKSKASSKPNTHGDMMQSTPSGRLFYPDLGPGFGTYRVATGGLIRRYGLGGSVFGAESPVDNVPALLMGGEYVINKNAVDKYGVGFFDMLNRGGQIRRYAVGGLVTSAQDVNKLNYKDPEDLLTKSISKLVAINQDIRDRFTGDGDTNRLKDRASALTNNISISVNVDASSGNVTSDVTTSRDNRNNKQLTGAVDEGNARQLATYIKNETIRVIMEQSRPGGVIYGKFQAK